MSATPPVSISTSPPPPSPPPPATNATSPPPPATNATTPPPSSTNATTTLPPLPPLPSPTINTTLGPPLPGPPEPPSGGLPTGALVGLIVGIGIGGLIVLIGVGIFVICYRRKSRRRQDGDGDGDGGPSPPQPQVPKTKNEHWQQNSLPPKDDKVTLFPKPTPPLGVVHSPEMVQVTTPPPASSWTTSSMDSDKPLPPPSPGYTVGLSQSTFSSEELAMATDGFSNTNLLGQGGFGYVRKGVLPNGKLVAIKQLKAGSGQGEREFRAEVEVISRVHHKHLVSLVGFCISGAQRMLVYEFVPNYTLDFHLHGKGRPTMNWPTRMKIALGSARGLAYLHEDCQPKIIHRDIKAANILIDDNFDAKVADFGLAKIALETDTHVSTRVMGTFGYLAPEYAASGKLTDKSDVFSFGVVLLELITGRHPIDKTNSFTEDSMVEWARPLLSQALESGNFDAVVDQRLQNDYNSSEMVRMVACAAACVRHSSRRRPRMSQIVRALEGNLSLDELDEGIRPGHSRAFDSFGSADYDSGQYKEDLKKFRKMALETQGLATTAEYNVLSSESVVHQSGASSEGQQTTQEVELGKVKNDTQDFD